MDGPVLEVERLKELIDNDEIDTVLVVFPDLQGRLMGKRVTGRFFRDQVLDGSIEACNYLLAVDVDMTPLPGYRYANWEQGYGDFLARPDLSTLRAIPWPPPPALVICDLLEDGGPPPIGVAPRQILKRQLE